MVSISSDLCMGPWKEAAEAGARLRSGTNMSTSSLLGKKGGEKLNFPWRERAEKCVNI